MSRFIFPFLLFAFCCSTALAEPACTFNESTAPKISTLKKGINLSAWWEDGPGYEPSDEELARLRTLGFDFVRLPVSPSKFEETNAGEATAELRCNLIRLLNNGFRVVVDLHPPSSFGDDLQADTAEGKTDRLKKIWLKLGQALQGLPPARLLLQLYNEPRFPPAEWWVVQGQLLKELRPSFPQHTFVLTASLADSDTDLTNRRPYADKNVMYDFHFYTPMFFTHHGASWIERYRYKRDPIPYPVPKNARVTEEMDEDTQAYLREGWNAQKLTAWLERIRLWKKRYGVRVACLEFGVYRPYVEDESRARWLGDMRNGLEKNSMPWALWEYRGGFGLIGDNGKIDAIMAKALGLDYAKVP